MHYCENCNKSVNDSEVTEEWDDDNTTYSLTHNDHRLMEPITHINFQTEPCAFCDQTGTVKLTIEQAERFGDYVQKRVRFIQDALPEVHPGIREQLMTGIHDECFNNAFSDED